MNVELTMAARICFSTTLPPDVRTTTTINGYSKYKMYQPGAGYYNEAIDAFDIFFINRTYYFTGDSNECNLRLINNMSDISSEFALMNSMLENIIVPYPFGATRETISGAYNLNQIREDQFSSALANFRLFDRRVYFVLISFFICFALLTCIKVFTQRSHSNKMHGMKVTCLYGQRFS